MHITKDDKLALIIRGHVRDALGNVKLYDLIERFTNEYDVDVYIYTFDVKSGGKIYGAGIINREEITEETILEYFKDIKIKKIIIDKNSVANTCGDEFVGPVSKNKFLHMWKSIYHAIKYVRDNAADAEYKLSLI